MRDYSRGIFDLPWPGQRAQPPRSMVAHSQELPPKHVADLLLNWYYSSMHATLPILHWPSFMEAYETIYQRRTLRDVTPVWASLLFAVFACGALHSTDNRVDRHRDSKAFLHASRSMMDCWEDEYTIDHAKVTLLTSIVLNEMNLRSASRACFGSCVRIAQNLGLHCDPGRWPVIEGETRRRVWWSIYVWDR